jgi:hypothetical protein
MTNTSLPPHLEHIGRQLTAAAHDLSASPRRIRRRSVRLAAASTTGMAAVAAAAVLAVGATSATAPAFAVTRHRDGSVSVKIDRRSGVAGANRELAAMGIHVRVVARGDGHSLQLGCMAPGPGANGNSLTITGYPTVSTGPTSAPASTSGHAGVGNTGAGGPAVGTTWHVVDCSSLSNADSTSAG